MYNSVAGPSPIIRNTTLLRCIVWCYNYTAIIIITVDIIKGGCPHKSAEESHWLLTWSTFSRFGNSYGNNILYFLAISTIQQRYVSFGLCNYAHTTVLDSQWREVICCESLTKSNSHVDSHQFSRIMGVLWIDICLKFAIVQLLYAWQEFIYPNFIYFKSTFYLRLPVCVFV